MGEVAKPMKYDRFSMPAGVSRLLLSLLFAGAYGQWPLYASNQNTYFLKGIALAEGGPLQRDWLVDSANHIPAFTSIVYGGIRWMPAESFYLIHGLVVAVYAYCLLWLIARVFRLSPSNAAVPLALVLLTAAHSEIIHQSLGRTGPAGMTSLATLLRITDGVARQGLLRHYLQPSTFGVLLIVSICLFVSGRSRSATVVGAITPWFHTVYFLPALVLTMVYVAVEWCRGLRRRSLYIAIMAFFLALPPLIYVWWEFGSASVDELRRAHAILIHTRFPHHAEPQRWFGGWAVFQIGWVLLALLVARTDRRLFITLAALFATGCMLTLLQVWSRSDQLAMVQPWRLSVLLVPISTALLVGGLANALLSRWQRNKRAMQLVRYTSLVLLSGLCVAGVSSTISKVERSQRRNQLAEFAARQCVEGATFLVPLMWAEFRLDSRCPIFVDWKSHPYRADEVVEWFERTELVRAFYRGSPGDSAAALEEIRDRSPLTHVVVRRGHQTLAGSSAARLVFKRGSHDVYQLDPRPPQTANQLSRVPGDSLRPRGKAERRSQSR